MREVSVYLFASLRDYTGEKTLKVEVPADATVGQLKDILIKKYPRLGKARNSILAAIDREYAADDTVIPDKAEIALFPPVSGG